MTKRLFLSASGDKSIKEWDRQAGECTRTYTGHTDSIRALAVLEGNRFLSASADKSIKEWDRQAGECTRTYTGHMWAVVALAVLEGSRFLSASKDGSVKEWDRQTGECTRTFTGHTSAVNALAVLPKPEPRSRAVAAARDARDSESQGGATESAAAANDLEEECRSLKAKLQAMEAKVARLDELEAVLTELRMEEEILKSGDEFRRFLLGQGFGREEKFEVKRLTLGKSEEAAGGIEGLIGVEVDDLVQARWQAGSGLEAMRLEFETHGDTEDKANFRYIVDGIAQDQAWIPEHVKTDIKNKKYHGGSLEPDDYDRNHRGMRLQGFVDLSEARLAKLKPENVCALRLYTTNSFRKLNEPLRRSQRPHPFAHTVFYIAEGLKKLRAVAAKINAEQFAAETVLWRGLSNMTVDIEDLKKYGGTEMGMMSTTADKRVAMKYSASRSPLILRYKTRGLTTGLSLRFLSVYPKEDEYLYPPGTFLAFEDSSIEDGVTTVTVSPQMA
jgi:hypothetical protein